MNEMIDQLCQWLNSQTINGDTIGNIRRQCFMPFDCAWNGIVRDETAKREVSIPPASADKAQEKPRTTLEEGCMCCFINCNCPVHGNEPPRTCGSCENLTVNPSDTPCRGCNQLSAWEPRTAGEQQKEKKL